jgi:hypothetical protein
MSLLNEANFKYLSMINDLIYQVGNFTYESMMVRRSKSGPANNFLFAGTKRPMRCSR